MSAGAACPLSCDQKAVYEPLTLSGTKYLGELGSLPDPLKRNGRYTASDTVCVADVINASIICAHGATTSSRDLW